MNLDASIGTLSKNANLNDGEVPTFGHARSGGGGGGGGRGGVKASDLLRFFCVRGEVGGGARGSSEILHV